MNKVFKYPNILFLILFLSTGLPCSRSYPQEECEATNTSSNDVDNESAKTSNKDAPKCTLYLGESTIPNAGLGIFSAIDIPQGSLIGSDIVIPLFDNKFSPLLGSYAWRGKDQASHNEANVVDNICPGIEAIVNGHTALMNVWAGYVDMDECNLHRSKDPGAGAFTAYHNLKSFATAPIDAGMELFAEYGDHWFTAEIRGGKFDYVPLSTDYDEADKLLEKFKGFRSGEASDIDDQVITKFWNFFRETVSSNDRVNSLLPENIDEMQKAAELGSAKFHTPSAIRSPEWLESEALCMDNLKEGISNIAQAGRGAFATKHLPKGSFVAPMPLIHECKPNSFLSDGKTQLLLNYCFGHRSSSVTLCPYGPLVSLINHSKEKANVELRWSTSTKLYSNEWLNVDKEKLCSMGYSSLLFDVIAINDILPGEEVYLNYGQEWEDAWNNHVKNWIPPVDSKEYKSASTFNRENIIRTIDEQKDNPYPDNVYQECFFTNPGPYEEIDGVFYQYYNGHDSYLDLHKCRILRRDVDPTNSTNFIYTVSMFYQPDWSEHYNVIISNMPRVAIKFSDVAYSSDMFLNNAFRHKIMISDDIFPNGWKDLE